MKNLFLSIIFICLISCGEDKAVQLPEISNSKVTEINDVSAAYLFYDETLRDSVELNRRNLISTTNWLINVDKRLTLKQVIPHIQYLQEKKGNSSHKNENAKNYFTCNDTSKQNLGFFEFTNSVYKNASIIPLVGDEIFNKKHNFIIYFNTENDIQIKSFPDNEDPIHSNIKNIKNDLITLTKRLNNDLNISLSFNSGITFQNYISMKSLVADLPSEKLSITDIEFISD
ncbi:hypothetical protein [uncultured Algibacter sp.]|uniref:hypothetical protein n=1 Tax=uncultured Algibacter sp. TaxID=298659 RepID=UPI0026113209|nr:hypothetical protein [uncultured Algibacter sp.]